MTVAVGLGTLAAMLGLGLVLHRLGRRNAHVLSRLNRQLDDRAAELASRNDQLKAAQGVAHIGSWDLTLATQELSWSEEFYRILGLSPENWQPDQELFFARVHPDDQPRLFADQEAAQSSVDGPPGEYRIVRDDGSVRNVQARAVMIRDGAGQLVRMVGSLQDITEQRDVGPVHRRRSRSPSWSTPKRACPTGTGAG